MMDRPVWADLWPGDIFLSMSHGNFISEAIASFQGRPGPSLKAPRWSHTGIYYGRGMVAEATIPRGKMTPVVSYLDSPKHLIAFYRVPALLMTQRERIAMEALHLTGRKYDKLNIVRHMVDNLFERLTWNAATQSGFRPLSRWIKDSDGTRRLVCSELVENAYAEVTGELMQPGRQGQARPLDVWNWLQAKNARLVLQSTRGLVDKEPKA